MAKTGVMQAAFGTTSLTDFLHVDNMVEAHILAAKALTKEKGCLAVFTSYTLTTSLYCQTKDFVKLWRKKPPAHIKFKFCLFTRTKQTKNNL